MIFTKDENGEDCMTIHEYVEYAIALQPPPNKEQFGGGVNTTITLSWALPDLVDTKKFARLRSNSDLDTSQFGGGVDTLYEDAISSWWGERFNEADCHAESLPVVSIHHLIRRVQWLASFPKTILVYTVYDHDPAEASMQDISENILELVRLTSTDLPLMWKHPYIKRSSRRNPARQPGVPLRRS
jgi:hypothetical protein